MNREHEIFVRTRNLISDPRKWCEDGWGGGGQRCLVHALSSVSGHGERCNDATLRTPAYAILCALADERYLGSWNDNHTHAAVLALLDDAIAQTAPEPDVSFVTEPEKVA